jgi:hypothetical protein
MPDSRLATPRRRAVAWTCADGPRGLAEISRATGIHNGPLSGLIKRMVADQILDCDGEPGSRGTLYELAQSARPELEAPLVGHDPGTLVADQHLVSVSGASLTAIAPVLARSGLTAELIWSARVSGANDWFLAFQSTTAPLVVDRLVAALEAAGATCGRSVVGLIMPRGELERYCGAVLDGAERATSVFADGER